MEAIIKEPTNERELVETRDFIKDTPNKVERQIQDLNDVYKHYCICLLYTSPSPRDRG